MHEVRARARVDGSSAQLNESGPVLGVRNRAFLLTVIVAISLWTELAILRRITAVTAFIPHDMLSASRSYTTTLDSTV